MMPYITENPEDKKPHDHRSGLASSLQRRTKLLSC